MLSAKRQVYRESMDKASGKVKMATIKMTTRPVTAMAMMTNKSNDSRYGTSIPVLLLVDRPRIASLESAPLADANA